MGVLVSNKMSAKNWEDMEIASGHDDSPSGGSKFGKLGCCIGGLFVLWLFCSIRIVPPAHSGLVVTFGSVRDSTLNSGMHLVHPLASVVSINLKTQLVYSENNVPTQEGSNVELDVALLYHVVPESVHSLYLSLGEDYEKTLIMPELQSAVRGLTSEVSAKALYTSGRSDIRDKLIVELDGKLKPRGIKLEDVLLKGIKLPDLLINAIEQKAQAEQASARMEVVVSKEKQEAERKKVEAAGIAAFQRIVSEGISPQLLQWKGIEATEHLAQSTNSKIVVMGNTKDSLPVLMGAMSDNNNQQQSVQTVRTSVETDHSVSPIRTPSAENNDGN